MGGLVLDRLVGKLMGSKEFSERWVGGMARIHATHSSSTARFESMVAQNVSITLTMKTIYDVLRKKESELERVRGEIEALRLVIPVLIDEGIVSEEDLKHSDDEHEETESEERANVR
jgi:ribosomal protein S2